MTHRYTDRRVCWRYIKLVYPHTHRHTEGLVCWYYYTPLHWVLLCHVIDCLYIFVASLTTLFIPVSYGLLFIYQSWTFLFIPVIDFLLIPVIYQFAYIIHQRPRGGERLAGRYSADERLRRLLRAGRCAGRVRSV